MLYGSRNCSQTAALSSPQILRAPPGLDQKVGDERRGNASGKFRQDSHLDTEALLLGASSSRLPFSCLFGATKLKLIRPSAIGDHGVPYQMWKFIIFASTGVDTPRTMLPKGNL